MSENYRNNTADFAAKMVSVLFHPLFIPVYGMLIILSAPTLFGFLPFSVKKILLTIIIVNNVAVPLIFLPYFKYREIIKSWQMETREERVLPLVITNFFYLVSVYIFWKFHLPLFIKSFMLAAAAISTIVTIVNFWWKISVHAVGAGALVALVVILALTMHSRLFILLIASIIAAGLILTVRLYKNSHSPLEVWVGFFTGMAGTGIILLFF
jgi:hypothetical protein